MHVALPEIDGRILARAISFKAASARDRRPNSARSRTAARRPRRASSPSSPGGWASLPPQSAVRISASPAFCRIIPARGGRTGYAVGLDTPASAVAIGETPARRGL